MEDSILAAQQAIDAFTADADNPFLVSFPRTGSHWLRMLMELYFQRPSLVRVFYYPDRTDYLLLHTHDLELDVRRSRVIYLYRDPVDTVFSQLSYYQEPLDDPCRVAYWSDLYGRHLDKWLHAERFTLRKAVLRYERMKSDLPEEFSKVVRFFGQELDAPVLEAALAKVTKDEVKRRTGHDEQVVQLDQRYEDRRRRFRSQQAEEVWKALTLGRPHLTGYF